MRRVLISVCASVTMLGGLVATAPRAVADAPEVLLGRSRLGEYQPIQSGDVLAWQQNSAQTPRHYDVFARPTGGEVFKVNPDGTNAANGAVDGDVLVYQQWAGGRSDVKFFDLGTRSRTSAPSDVNSEQWEYWPKMDGQWLLFGRLNTNTRARQIILYNLEAHTSTRLDQVSSADGFMAPGQVNGNFAVWSRCRRETSCDVLRYDIASGTRRVIGDAGSAQYAPSVAPDGTVFYARSRGGCGQAVRLYGQPPTGTATKLWRLPSGDNVSSTHLYENADGRQTLLYDHYACGQAASSDIWQMIDPMHFELAVTLNGSGTGTVTSSPIGIDCGSDCSGSFDPGTEVTLTARADDASAFAGWGGACSGHRPTCTVTMNASLSVTATFSIKPVLSVTVIGGGVVTSSPAGINCGTDCSEAYGTGTDVTLTATASAGSAFVGWSGGGCSGTGTTCVVDMDSSKSVTATFEDVSTLEVVLGGDGTGTVTGTGIACPPDCTATYDAGTAVTLTATPTAPSTFVGWSGACSGTGSCQLTMESDRTVTALFDDPTVPSTTAPSG